MSGSPPRRRTSTLVIAIVTVLVLVLTGVGVAVVATGDDREREPALRLGEIADPPAPRDASAVGAAQPLTAGGALGETGPAETLSPAEQALADMLPPTAAGCEATEPVGTDEVAALVCVVGVGGVTYRQFEDDAATRDYYELETPQDIEADGDCSEDWNRDTTWESAGRSGRLKCYDTEDAAVLEWTDDDVPVHGYEFDPDFDRDLLRRVFEEGDAALLR